MTTAVQLSTLEDAILNFGGAEGKTQEIADAPRSRHPRARIWCSSASPDKHQQPMLPRALFPYGDARELTDSCDKVLSRFHSWRIRSAGRVRCLWGSVVVCPDL